MTGDLEREKAVRGWLSTDEALSLVRRAAKSVLRMAREKRCSFTFRREALTRSEGIATDYLDRNNFLLRLGERHCGLWGCS